MGWGGVSEGSRGGGAGRGGGDLREGDLWKGSGGLGKGVRASLQLLGIALEFCGRRQLVGL